MFASFGARHRALAVGLLAASSLAFPALAQDAAAPDMATAPGDIVVTAQRRAESVQTIPIAITALGSDLLEARQIDNTTDLGKSIPNFYAAPLTASGSTIQIALRGGSESSSGLVVSETPVAIYVDDVYRARLAGANFEFNDIERIEVLRGPQGTLYGRNAFSGAIKIVSRSPIERTWLNAEATAGSRNELRFGASAGGRVAENLGASFSALYRERDGYTYNVALGRKVGGESSLALRGKLEFEPTEALNVTGIVSYSRDRNDGPGGATPTAPIVPFPTKAANFITPAQLRFLAGSPFRTFSPIEPDGRNDQFTASLNVKADLGGVTLRSITAYVDTKDGFRFDLDAGRQRADGSFYFLTLDRTSRARSKQFTQEFLLVGDALDQALQYTAGVYYFREKSNQTFRDNVTFSFPTALLPTTLDTLTQSYAGFAEVSVMPVERLTLTAGLRYTRDDKEFDASLQGALNFNPTPPYPAQTLAFVSLDPSFSSWTPKFGIDFQATPDLLVYASVSRGFKAGGFNGLSIGNPAVLRAIYDPQTIWAYEAGLKLRAFDRRLTANLSVFRNEFGALQQTQQIAPGSFAQVNIGDARLDGIELELAAKPVDGLDVFFNLALNDDKYKSINPLSTAAVAGATRLPLTARVSYQMGATYMTPAIGDFASIRLNANYRYRGSSFAAVDNLLKTEGYGLLDASIGLVTVDKHWSLTLNGRNLTDKLYFPSATGQNAIGVGEPRTWLLTLRYDM